MIPYCLLLMPSQASDYTIPQFIGYYLVGIVLAFHGQLKYEGI